MECLDFETLQEYRGRVHQELADEKQPPLNSRVYDRVLELVQEDNNLKFVGLKMEKAGNRPSLFAIEKNGEVYSGDIKMIKVGSLHVTSFYRRFLANIIPRLQKNHSTYTGYLGDKNAYRISVQTSLAYDALTNLE